jgi:tripartite-type tricarboxylate transporter receptor subunit TctC
MKRYITQLIFALVLAGTCFTATAQPFPTSSINLVIPVAPGDAADITAHALGDEMSKLLKTSVIVINRPGAGGAVGTNSVVQARKDGYTILFAQNSALTMRAVLDAQTVAYDALRDLTPLGVATRTPSVVAVRGDAAWRNFAGLVEFMKQKPGQLRMGHPGAGSVGEFCVQLIGNLTGAQMVPVPYTGAAPAIVALRGGHIEGVVAALGALSSHFKLGALRGLATSSRFPEFADIPTLRELGYKEDLFGIWFTFFAPAGIPEDAKKTLTGAIEQAVKTPAIAAKLLPLGILQSYAAPDQAVAEMREEFKRVSDIVRRNGLVK